MREIPKQDPQFERTIQRARYVGWSLMTLTLAAALAGVFGAERAGYVLKAGAVYLFLLLMFRIAGRRTLGEMTTFDFILVLIISESTQQALVGNDPTLFTCFSSSPRWSDSTWS